MTAWLPLFQTLSWAVFAVVVLLFLGRPLRALAAAASWRLRAGRPDLGVEDGWAAECERLQALPYVGPADQPPPDETVDRHPEWTLIDEPECGDARRVFLAHAVAPHPRQSDRYQVYVLLVGHRRDARRFPDDLGDIARAQFFLGRPWRNRVFDVRGAGATGLIGIRTIGAGPAVCRCRIHFRDGHTAVVSRYLDFEMTTAFGRPGDEG